MNEQTRTICDFLRSVGAEKVRMGRGKKHPRVYYEWKGDERYYVVPGSPGDVLRGAKNAIADLRRELGLVAAVKRVGARRLRKNRAPKPSARLVTISAMDDWCAALTSHVTYPAVLKARENLAWKAWWRDLMGGESRL